ncbi:MAG: RnfABCDGE type electron transport complex subunit B [Gammaproteobacteria bacterium]|nr:RnfABCDGE type electron transport complex subunit B [Gammaproteobacteria bacterium]
MRADANRILTLLPQTQCTRCGYQGCRPYAEAIAAGRAAINRCPPGGAATIDRLATLLDVDPLPLDTTCGTEAPATVAFIDETKCIGCARCLPPCPVDAIVGAQRQTHTVINDLCTGCERCIAPCPADCISIVPRAVLNTLSPEPTAASNRNRFDSHQTRRLRYETERRRLLDERKQRISRPGS